MWLSWTVQKLLTEFHIMGFSRNSLNAKYHYAYSCALFIGMPIWHAVSSGEQQEVEALGIKQGGINSPELFSGYVDELIKLLRESKIGCHLYKMYLAIIMFADDICLLAPTRSALQSLMDKAAAYCNKIGLNFNPLKSKILVFSKKKVDTDSLQSVTLNNCPVDYVTSVKYLGVVIESNHWFCFSATNDVRTFYRAANSIWSALLKPPEDILMKLLCTNRVPILSYACDVKCFSAKDMRDSRDCNTAINDAVRKIFSFNRWESVRSLREGFNLKSIYEIFALSKQRFHDSLAHHRNSVLRQIFLNSDIWL